MIQFKCRLAQPGLMSTLFVTKGRHPIESGATTDSERHSGICLAVVLICLVAFSVICDAGSWTALAKPAPNFPGTMIMLSDGTIMVQNGVNLAAWMRLKPDSHGSYVNGTWIQDISPMSLPRLYFASTVLPSGKIWVLGGEYSGNPLVANLTPQGEIWDPVANTWSAIAQYPDTFVCPSGCFGDDPSMLLSATKILAGDIFLPTPQIYDLPSNSWSPAGTKFYNDSSDEETWVKLPNGNILTYDIFQSVAAGAGYAEVYNPTTNVWTSITPIDGHANGRLPLLTSVALGYELGPALRLQDGRIFSIGANNRTALYDVATNTWAPGPLIPGGFGADDAPGAEMPNGRVIFAADNASSGHPFTPPAKVFEYDPLANTITEITPAGDTVLPLIPAYPTRMLVLPTGQVLLNDSSEQMWIYTPDPPVVAAARPVIRGVTYNGGGIFTLTGNQLDGQSAGSSYGDDVQSDENFPIVRLRAGDNVYYCRTTNWTTVGANVSSTLQSVNFTLNPAVQAGTYSLVVSGAGIPSLPLSINITEAEVNGQ